jgi:long-chain acyl-CoA synthetase
MDTQLDSVYRHERDLAERVWLTQPMGGGVVRDLTWREAMAEARRMAEYLRGRDFPPGSRIAILSKNCAWWFLADLAIFMAGHVSVPVYPTLTADTLRQILEHSGARLVFVGKLDAYSAMAPGIPASVDRVAFPLSPDRDARRWDDIVASTAPVAGSPRRAADDLATIIYTSGSTGASKGIMHSFRTMCAAAVYLREAGYSVDDRAISYLPLAHVAERAVLMTPSLLVGFRVFFAESLETFIDDVRRARPTIFGSVPRLWLKLQSGVFERIPQRKLDRLLRIPIVRGVVRRKVLEGLGLDQVRMAACGSAPVPAELLEWYRTLGLDIREIYAMSENFAVSHMTRPGGRLPGYVGPPLPGVEQRLTDEGEVLVRSPGTMLGYYEAPELTREVIDADGWVHTGDRGQLSADGQLRITGRVKELFKTSKGKYIAPAPIESLLLASPLLDQACVVDIGLGQPAAIVVRSPAAHGEAHDTLAERLEQLRDRVNRLLDPHEHLDRIIVVADEWTVDNGLLTPTMKLRRAAIEERYARERDAWQSASQRVFFAQGV